MDSQRRHELEQNTLYQAMAKAPSLLWEYGSYVLLAIAVGVALYFFFSTRTAAEVQERAAEAASLNNMSDAVEHAHQLRQFASFLDPDEVQAQQADIVSDFQAFANLPATSERAGVRSHAARLRGDLFWNLATFPEPRPAATRPATQPATSPTTQPDDPLLFEDPSDEPAPVVWLREAETAYLEVVNEYPNQTSDLLAALFGLAAIAEQRGEFEAAQGFYDQLIAHEDFGEAIKTQARQRKAMAGVLALSPRLAPPAPPATQPATLPSTQPATQPSDGDGVTPAAEAPTTAPSTQPVE